MGLNQESREKLEYLFREWEMERDPEEMIRESMAPVRQAAIGPMLVGWEQDDPTVGNLADVLRQSTIWYFWWD